MQKNSWSANQHQSVRNTIRNRRTLKVLGDTNHPLEISREICDTNRPLVLQAIADAGCAPFHYDRNHQSIAEPWRFHLLWHEQCRKIAANFFEWFDGDIKPNTKIPAMLSASGALIIVNWLPQEGLAKSEKSTLINEEHLAATAAAVQNLLLLLTAHGMGTYWSSGGQFRSEAMFSRMGISPVERLLAAVFVEFPETMNLDMERLPGKQRKNRTSVDNWLNVVEIE